MSKVEIHRHSDGLHTSLGYAYPYAVDVPLSSYLLHQDAKSHLSVEFDRQTQSLVGSNTELASMMADGLQHARAELRGFSENVSDHLSETNEWLSTIDSSLNRVCDHLVVIETGIDRLTIAVRKGTGEVVGALGQISAQLTELNQSASQIAKMLKDEELTWALEQARHAARAMRVGDLLTAEAAATRATTGGGGHVGAPTHVVFMLQLAEILIRQGQSRISDAGDVLDRAEQYLLIEPSEELRARYQYARGSHSLARATKSGMRDDLVTAEAAFRSASAVKRYATVATIWKAVADTRLGTEREEIIKPLARLMHAKPYCVLEIMRLRSNGLDPEMADSAIKQATALVYRDTADVARFSQTRQKALEALDFIQKLKHTRASNDLNTKFLTELSTCMEMFINRAGELRGKNTLSSACQIKREKYKAENKIETIRSKLKDL